MESIKTKYLHILRKYSNGRNKVNGFCKGIFRNDRDDDNGLPNVFTRR
jgi:hypothetical protein